MKLETLEPRDCPAVFNPAIYAEGYTPIPGWNGPTQEFYGDVDGDGAIDHGFAAGEGGSARVVVYSGQPIVISAGLVNPAAPAVAGASVIFDKVLFGESFRGGATVETVRQADGSDDLIVTPGVGGGPVVEVVSLNHPERSRSFYAFDPGYRGGLRITGIDLTNDGVSEIVSTTLAGGAPVLTVLDINTGEFLASFYIGPESDRSGAYHIASAGILAVPLDGAKPQFLIDGPAGTRPVLFDMTGTVVHDSIAGV